MVDDTYQGEPRATLSGKIVEEGQPIGLVHRADLRIALFWSSQDPIADDLETLIEQTSTGRPVGLSADYVLHLYDIPQPEHRVSIGSDAGGDDTGWYAIGRILVYADDNGNARRDADEAWLGGARPLAVLYASDLIAAERSPTRLDLPAGYRTVQLPLPCDAPKRPTTDGDCGVALGASCDDDWDCGAAGVCLRQVPMPWPGNACAVPEPPADGCRPDPAGFVGAGGLPEARGAVGFWVQACVTDADCDRGPPYGCDVGAGACVPMAPLKIGLSIDWVPPPFCAPAPGEGRVQRPPVGSPPPR